MIARQKTKKIPRRHRDAILHSLRIGVVPRIGHQHIQVGRDREVAAVLDDIERVKDGGSAVRFVVGDYGAGKSFFLYLVRAMALAKQLVTVHADFTPDRRLFSTGKHAVGLYTELTRNMSTRAKEGGAVRTVVERFVGSALREAEERNVDPSEVIGERLSGLEDLTGGYDFAAAVNVYWWAHENGDPDAKRDVVRWLRGEFSTRVEARQAIGVRTIVTDRNYYDFLKLFALMVRQAGFGGLLVCLDEGVNLYKLHNSRSRHGNYEQILRIVNDCTQGTAEGIGFLFGVTRDMLEDTHRGLCSYRALGTRLERNRFAAAGDVEDFAGPLLELDNLTAEDLFVLLRNIRRVFAGGDPDQHLVPDDALTAFMSHCSNQIGDAYFTTPRATIKEFVHFLSTLEQNPRLRWTDLVEQVRVETETNPDLEPLEYEREEPDDELVGLRL